MILNNQLYPEKIPSPEERTEVLGACMPVPHGVSVLVAEYAMEVFETYGPEQWKEVWGATPVILPPVEQLRGQVNKIVASTGRKPEKEVEKLTAEECANFLGLQGEEEHPEPPKELHQFLNRRLRPQDNLVAGFTCAVTFIPQFVNKDGRILPVTARTLALDIGPHPRQGQIAKLADPVRAFDKFLFPEDAERTEPSCYFVMERQIAPDTAGRAPSILLETSIQQGNKGWPLPEPRNFIATVFSRRAWKDQVLYRKKLRAVSYTFCHGVGRDATFLALGGFDDAKGLYVLGLPNAGYEHIGASGSRKFPPLTPPGAR